MSWDQTQFMTFKELGIIDPIINALHNEGYEHPTQIQEEAIPALLDGKDLLACAQTGTGKTAAFAIPILQHIYNNKNEDGGRGEIQALVITPTRELAIQVADSFKVYGKFTGVKNTVVYGGVKQGSQTQALRRGVDVLVATPGRLLDLMNQGYVKLGDVKYLVLDEADRMLDMGFIHDIRKILSHVPAKRQSVFISATISGEIGKLSGSILRNPVKVEVAPEQTTAEKIVQSVYFVPKRSKSKLLIHLLKDEPTETALVFSRTKHGANKLVKMLGQAGIRAEAIHGNKSQNRRQQALGNLKSGRIKVLVATDVAARGIDVDELSKVINFDIPDVPETYIHRIGRTGRAGSSGKALSFCDKAEMDNLRQIQKLIDQKIPVVTEHPFVNGQDDEPDGNRNQPSRRTGGQGQNGNNKWRGKRKRTRNNYN